MSQRILSRVLSRFFYDRHAILYRSTTSFHTLTGYQKAGRANFRRRQLSSNSCYSYVLSFSLNNHRDTCTCLIPKRRLSSTSSDETSLGKRLIERWVYEVNPFGKLEISSPIDVEISSLNPHECPEMNRVVVTVLTRADGQNDNGRAFADMYNMQTDLCPEKKTVTVTYDMAESVDIPVVCLVKVPVKFDLKVRNTHPCSLSVDGSECEEIDIVLNKGDCSLTNIKCGEVSVDCTDGNITSKSLQGNINLKTRKHGNIKADRLQGLTVMCCTEVGNMDIQTLYSGRNKFSCCHGHLHIGSCHGNTFVKIDTGNLKIDSLTGNLRANIESGNVDVFIEPDMQHENVDITCDSGDIHIKCTESLESKVNIVADSLSVDANMFEHSSTPHEQQTKYSGFLKNDKGGEIFAHTKQGKVTISPQTWLSSIGLKFRDS